MEEWHSEFPLLLLEDALIPLLFLKAEPIPLLFLKATEYFPFSAPDPDERQVLSF